MGPNGWPFTNSASTAPGVEETAAATAGPASLRVLARFCRAGRSSRGATLAEERRLAVGDAGDLLRPRPVDREGRRDHAVDPDLLAHPLDHRRRRHQRQHAAGAQLEDVGRRPP